MKAPEADETQQRADHGASRDDAHGARWSWGRAELENQSPQGEGQVKFRRWLRDAIAPKWPPVFLAAAIGFLIAVLVSIYIRSLIG